jgi:hypothetical protein
VHSEELGLLVKVVNSGIVTGSKGRQWRVELEAKEDILWVMWRVLGANPATKILFGEAKGFSLLLSVLESIQADEEGSRMLRRDVLFGLDESQASSTVNPSSSLHQKPETQSHMELFTSLMHVLTVVVADMPVNCNFLHESLVSPAFKRLLLKSGLLCEQHEDKIAELLFHVALERVHSPLVNTLDEQCKCSQFQVI